MVIIAHLYILLQSCSTSSWSQARSLYMLDTYAHPCGISLSIIAQELFVDLARSLWSGVKPYKIDF